MKKIVLAAYLAIICLYSCTGSRSGAVKDEGVELPVGQDVIFSLSMVANIPATTYCETLSGSRGDSANAVGQIMAYSSPKMDVTLRYATDTTGGQMLRLSKWKRVWGPGVAVDRSLILARYGAPFVSTASLTIFKDTTANDYVVAIQATNPYSNYAWSQLDFNISTVSPWTSFCNAPNSGVLSKGTYLGLQGLLSLNAGTTAQQFLDSVIKTGTPATHIVVTGHSLGGELAPVFALYMQHQADSLDKDKHTVIYCMATAGATPGDSVFANYYNKTLGSRTVSIANTMDLVPRAWDSAMLAMVKPNVQNSKNTLVQQPYAFMPIATPTGITGIINDALGAVAAAPVRYKHICNGGNCFSGATYGSKDSLYLKECTDSTEMEMIGAMLNLIPGKIKLGAADYNFLAEEGRQHVGAYYLHYNIKQIHEYIKNLADNDNLSIANIKCNFPFKNRQLPLPPTPAGITPYSVMLGIIYLSAWQ